MHKETDQYCNHAVVNRYMNGEDHIGLHRDKVRDFEPGTSVLTVSLGVERLFRLKHSTSGKIIDILLQPGRIVF